MLKSSAFFQAWAILRMAGFHHHAVAIMFTMSLVLEMQADEKPHSPSFEKLQLSDQFYCEGATCADIDGDGNQDYIAGPYWFAGPGFHKPHEYRHAEPCDIGGYSDNFFTFVYDINKDGRVDILVISIPGSPAYWFENPGNYESHWPRHFAFPAVDNESPTLVDVVGDDNLELLCQAEGRIGFVTIPKQITDSSWPFHPITPALGYGKFTHGLGCGDLNHDGRPDVLEKNGWWQQPSDLSSNTPWEFHPVQFSELGGAQMLVADFDGDGDQDVVTSKNAHGYGLAWFENIGRPDAPEFREHIILDNSPNSSSNRPLFSQLHALTLADMNQDGVPDIITGKRYWAHGGNDSGANGPAVLYWFETVRSQAGVEFCPHLIDRNSGVGTQVEARDVNGDKLDDILVGNKKGLFIFIQKK